LTKESNRGSINPEQRLMITLRFLASGDSYHSLSYAFRTGISTISNIIPEVCHAIYEELAEKYIRLPSTPQEWREVAEGFEERWQFPHALGKIFDYFVCFI
jgi:hypothetical protein